MKKLFLILILTLVASVAIMNGRASGVAFTLTNVGTSALQSVTVHVTGKIYSLGDLAPGGSKTFIMDPTGESHIELGFSGSRRLRIDCYFESGYSGKITAEVTPEHVVSIKDTTRAPAFF